MVMFGSYMVVTAVAARLVRRLGFTVMLAGGLVLMGAGALALLAAGPFDGFGLMWPGLLIAGIGSGLIVAPSTAAAVNAVPALQAGMASAAVNMFRQLGSVLGPAVLGTVVTTQFARNLSHGLGRAQAFTTAAHLGFLIAGIVLLAMAVPVALFVRHRNATG